MTATTENAKHVHLSSIGHKMVITMVFPAALNVVKKDLLDHLKSYIFISEYFEESCSSEEPRCLFDAVISQMIELLEKDNKEE